MASSSSNLQDYMQRHGNRATNDPHSLPANQKTVMGLLSEPREMPYKQLCKAVEDLPEKQRLNQSQLDGTLYELIRSGYLTSFMENGDVVYMVQVDMGTPPPPPRHEQRLMRKLDLGALSLDDLPTAEDEITPDVSSPRSSQTYMRKLNLDDLQPAPEKDDAKSEPPKTQQGFMRKLDLSELNLDDLQPAPEKEDAKPESPKTQQGFMRKLDLSELNLDDRQPTSEKEDTKPEPPKTQQGFMRKLNLDDILDELGKSDDDDSTPTKDS